MEQILLEAELRHVEDRDVFWDSQHGEILPDHPVGFCGGVPPSVD